MIDMKIWWILASDHYYPGLDNFHSSHITYEEAVDYIKELKLKKEYDIVSIVDISHRLR